MRRSRGSPKADEASLSHLRQRGRPSVAAKLASGLAERTVRGQLTCLARWPPNAHRCGTKAVRQAANAYFFRARSDSRSV